MINIRHAVISGLAALGLVVLHHPASAETVRVVTSIKPVHSLASMVLSGIADPYLIVKGPNSPHGFTMRPSDARSLAEADAVFWIGPDLETFLIKPLATLSGKARVVALGEDHAHEDDDQHGDAIKNPAALHEEKHEAADGHAHRHDVDPHLWLSPVEAVEMIEHIADVMIKIIPTEAKRIIANRNRAIEELVDVDAEVRMLVNPMQGESMVALHEAYDHFTRHFGLNDFIALTVTPEHKPSPGRIAEVRKLISSYAVRCVFSEPQYSDQYVRLLVEGTSARIATIDPLGATLQPGPALYPQLIRLMGFAIRGCYEETS